MTVLVSTSYYHSDVRIPPDGLERSESELIEYFAQERFFPDLWINVKTIPAETLPDSRFWGASPSVTEEVGIVDYSCWNYPDAWSVGVAYQYTVVVRFYRDYQKRISDVVRNGVVASFSTLCNLSSSPESVLALFLQNWMSSGGINGDKRRFRWSS